MSLLDGIVDHVEDAGLRLRKASPRGPDRLLLELTDTDGNVLAGQWHRDPARSAEIAQRTRTRYGHESVDILDRTGIIVQHGGADRRLPALRPLVQRPGARLVAHRAERRGVVRDADGAYTKVVRPDRARDLVDALVSIEVPSLALPRVTGVDELRGTITTAPLPGCTLHVRLGDRTLTDDNLACDAKNIGTALRDLHARQTAPRRRPHGVSDELDGARRWLRPATAYGLITAEGWQAGLDRAAALLAGHPCTVCLVHRDLHDKQVLLDDGQPVGMLDFDLATTGEPALDLANLLVHLRLRSLQGLCGTERAEVCCGALLEGYAPDRQVLDRVPGYALSTRLRLAAVYAFRAASPDMVEHLLRHTDNKGLSE